MVFELEKVNYNNDGLVPAIVQDMKTKDVLMLAYMNEESLKITLATGNATYYSRSRQEIWKKGATSGNTQKVINISYDCDQDSILLQVEQKGVACHTGEWSCFEGVSKQVPSVIDEIFETIVERRLNPKKSSYTTYLFEKGIDKILKKVGEETSEVIIGAKNEGTEEVIYEISDLVYHVLVLMVEKGVTVDEIREALRNRREVVRPS